MNVSRRYFIGGMGGSGSFAELVFNYASPGASFRIDRCVVSTNGFVRG
jgi:hypothetical protein